MLTILPHIHFFGMWLFVYECDFLFKHNLAFEPRILFEDVLFSTYVFTLTQRAVFVDTPFYHYRICRQDSIMNTKTCKRAYHGASSHFVLAKRFYEYALLATNAQNKAYLLHWSIFYAKESLRDIQGFGYVRDLSFSKADMKAFMPLLPMKYRFCAIFPRIYGFPKKFRDYILRYLRDLIGFALRKK